MRLIIFKPVHPSLFITQQFGANNACVNNENKVIGCIGDPPIGYKKLYASFGLKGHNGLDIVLRRGQPVYAAHPGIVLEVETQPSKGLGVQVRTEVPVETSSYTGYHKTIYWHLLGYNVKVGQKVKVGDCIGWGNNTGYSGGDHLHFGLAPCDEKGIKILRDNGYDGYIDPVPYLSQFSAIEARGYIVRILEAFAIFSENLAEYARSYK